MMEKPTLTRISKIAIAIAFSFVVCGTAVRPALAADRRDSGGDRHNDRGDAGRGRDNDRGGVYYAPQPDYYYAPQPDYYYAPEPDYYYAPQPEYYPAPPSEGINLFFGLR